MRASSVPAASKRVGYLVIGATLIGVSSLAFLVPVQELPSGRIGLAGQLDPPLHGRITFTAQLPRGYGLAASERREGWPELNEQDQVEVVLDGSVFEVRLPPARYCTHRFWWQKTPPPPLWLTLRFSDAPGEEYVVWATQRASFYFVRDASGTEQPKTWAIWRLHLGDYHQDPSAADRVWLLDVRLERLKPKPSPEGEERANA